jgi:transposase
MNLHGHAKTNEYQRQLYIHRVRHLGWTQRQAADAVGVSVRTVAKWLTRVESLADRSSRPHRSPRRTSVTMEAAVVRLRRARATAWQISAALGLPRSTVTGVLARRGLNRVTACDPIAPVERYAWPHAGDLLHVDMKRLGRMVGGAGHRIHGDRRRHTRGAGFDWLHVAVDDATRLAYVEVLAAEDAPTCAAFLRRACAWYRRRGIRIRRLLSDNGSHIAPASSRRPAAPGTCGTGLPGPIAPRPMARPSDSSRRCCANGPTASRIAARRGGPRRPRVPAHLQPQASPRESRSTLAVDAFPGGCLIMNNLFEIRT